MAFTVQSPPRDVLMPPTVGPQKVQGGQGLLPPPSFMPQQQPQQPAGGQDIQALYSKMQDSPGAPPKLTDAPKAPEIKAQDPMQAFANPGALFTLIGSFKTRHPMTTAMNAAAGMVTSFQQGDLARMQQQRQTWLDQVKEAQDHNKMLSDSYHDAWENSKGNTQNALAQIRALAAMHNDPTMLAAVSSGNVGAVKGMQESRDKASSQMTEAVPGLKGKELTGNEFLSTLPPDLANEVRAIADGRQSPAALGRAKDRALIMSYVNQYKPDYDQNIFAKRAATMKEFSTGVQARNVASINTAINHMKAMKDAADSLDNTEWKVFNDSKNKFADQFGSPKLLSFQTAATALADELGRVFKGTTNSDTEVKRWETLLNNANSPEQFKAVFEKGVDLLNGRLDALSHQYSSGMSEAIDPNNLLTPTAKEIWNSLEKPEHLTAPMEGAKKAPDGNWYVEKDGKYFKVEK